MVKGFAPYEVESINLPYWFGVYLLKDYLFEENLWKGRPSIDKIMKKWISLCLPSAIVLKNYTLLEVIIVFIDTNDIEDNCNNYKLLESLTIQSVLLISCIKAYAMFNYHDYYFNRNWDLES